jgi:hypothetical protein
MDEDKRVEPSRLLAYREQHYFQTPLCLCPLLQTLTEQPTITEAAILKKKKSETYVDEYVAECASGRCGYFGECTVIFKEREVINKNKAQFL